MERSAVLSVVLVAVVVVGCARDAGEAPRGRRIAAAEPVSHGGPGPEVAMPSPERDGTGEPAVRPWPGPPRVDSRSGDELGPGERHRHLLALESDRLLRFVVEQLGVDVEVTLEGPDGEELLRVDRPTHDRGSELVLVVTRESGVHTLAIEAFPGSGPGRYEVRIEALAPATQTDRAAAETYRGFREAVALPLEVRAASWKWREAATFWAHQGEPLLEGEMLATAGRDLYHQRDYEASAKRNREAIAAFARAGARRWEALLRTGLGFSLLPHGELEESSGQFAAALELAREIGDRQLEGRARLGLGTVHHRQGELQEALTQYEAALSLLPPGHNARPGTLHDLGVLHHLYFENPGRARELLVEALDLWRDDASKRRTLSQLARLDLEAGRPREARRHLEAALALAPDSDPCGRGTLLARLATAEDSAGRAGTAAAWLREALAAVEGETCPRSEVTVHLHAGELAARWGDAVASLESYERAAEIAERFGDRTRLAEVLAEVARTRRSVGDDERALAAGRRALAIVEEVRPTLAREDLRTGYFATARAPYDFHVGLLADLGRAEEAWLVAERGRARALRDLLEEARVGVRRDRDPKLAERERKLWRRINRLDYARRTASESRPERLHELRRELDERLRELASLRGEIRRRSPSLAAANESRPLDLGAVQAELLEDDDLLLEYRLGEEASWLWAITRSSIELFRLPPREDVERLAQDAVRWLRTLDWPGFYPPAVCDLSRAVLAPVADSLGARRLIVVADGALETVPFAALPVPGGAETCGASPPLVASRELVHLPSVAALLAERGRRESRRPSPWRIAAVVADPVYASDDPRLGGGLGRIWARFARSEPEASGAFERLPESGEEAAAIVGLLPPDRVFVATGTGASKALATGGALAPYRILHFATHGVLHPEEPLLSFLALSMRDARGVAVDGALYAYEIYDLELAAELVVLSACETAAGRHVAGEGLVSGLPRAFLHAGASRVLVSLWPLEDASARQLMERFYRGLVEADLSAGEALARAQRELWRAGRPPRQWAAFVLQGDPRPLPPLD